MAYGVDAQSFLRLEQKVREIPDEIPEDIRPFEGVLFSYFKAFETLLMLVMAIMTQHVELMERRRYVVHFLPIYDQAARSILRLLEAEIREGLQKNSRILFELLNAIRDSHIAQELVALDTALSESEGVDTTEDHLDTATTVTNSFKDQIEKHTKRKWIKSVLHSINEIISIVRGVV